MNMRVLFATPELAPWVKSGGLGDVSQALPPALARAGVELRVLVPAYPALRQAFAGAPSIAELPVPGGAFPPARLREAQRENAPPLWLLDCPAYFDRAGDAYQDASGRDHEDNARRFGLLSWAAALLAGAASPIAWRPEILHGNDWPLGLAPAFAHFGGSAYAATVMAVHNFAFQGNFALGEATALGLPTSALTPDGVEYHGHLSFLKAGLQFASKLVTVSPRYAAEVLHEEFGYGLAGLLRWREKDLSGILNGIDTDVWNPATDTALTAPYRADDLAGKTANTASLRTRLGLAPRADLPLLGMVGRLTEQKGVDLVGEIAAELLRLPAQLVILGRGEKWLEAALRELAARHPGEMAAQIGFDEGLAHHIEAGADIFLMPSRFEPCGLNQMYSMRYGTPPVVRAVGGLADTVVDFDEANLAADLATGFTFHEAQPQALLQAVHRAAMAWHDRPRWERLMQNGMRRDFSWEPVAARYLALYRAAMAA